MRALDELIVRWAAGTLPDACRWLLNTQLLFLRKDIESKNKDFDDEQWTLEELSWDANVPEAVMIVQEDIDDDMTEVVGGKQGLEDSGGNGEAGLPPAQGEAAVAPVPKAKVRPIQMGEFLRKWACRRLLQVAKPDIGKVMWTMRQLGVGAPGGAEALAVNCPGHLPGSKSMKETALGVWNGQRLGKRRWKRSPGTTRHYAGNMKKLPLYCSLVSCPCRRIEGRNRVMWTAPWNAPSLWGRSLKKLPLGCISSRGMGNWIGRIHRLTLPHPRGLPNSQGRRPSKKPKKRLIAG